jgi:glycosyltransferase involved in cell wall biosynthesis
MGREADMPIEQSTPPIVTPPLVSAIVSAYNSERFIRRCLEDLEAQTIADRLEIVVVDSGSSENEEAIVREFQQRYDNILYIRTAQRESVYAAWNRGIQAAHGMYITNANTDDRHKRDAFERMVAILEERPDIALVYADTCITNTENEIFETHTPAGRFNWPDFDPLRLIYYCFIGPQPMWRKGMHTKYGYFDESFESAGDWEFWLRMAETETFLHLREFLGLYLSSPASAENRDRELTSQENVRVHQRYLHRADRLKNVWAVSGATITNMDHIIWFNNFQVGQRLRAKGTPGGGDTFLAFEIHPEDPADLAIVQGFVQSIDHQSNRLRILNRELVLPSSIEVKGSQDEFTDWKALKAADKVTLWGKYSEPEGFMPEKIKITGFMAFGIEELRGNISRIDRENKILHINDFAVVVNEKTTRK